MVDCVFCRILKGEVPATRVVESDKVLVFLDVRPYVDGHCLIIPKGHFVDVLDVPDDVLGEVALYVKRAAVAVKRAFRCDGVSVMQNNGVAAGQVVFHLHFHVVPRFDGDGLRVSGSRHDYESGEEAEGFARLIRDNMK